VPIAARPSWEWHLRLSLVTCPVSLYKATEAKAGIRGRDEESAQPFPHPSRFYGVLHVGNDIEEVRERLELIEAAIANQLEQVKHREEIGLPIFGAEVLLNALMRRRAKLAVKLAVKLPGTKLSGTSSHG
jgi:hypothetical protein